ncbi:MAG TPA: DUF167 domain-containing protein, partial [Gemmatimonadaceae bacterium]|nr:DUF167 domain-containing protein [Gemmatimonadaceae bacterium]
GRVLPPVAGPGRAPASVTDLRVAEIASGVRVAVHVQPRAKRSEIAGRHGDALKVRLAAPPVDGAANAELVALFARIFAVPERGVRIVVGAHSRAKVVEIDGITPRDLARTAIAAAGTTPPSPGI